MLDLRAVGPTFTRPAYRPAAAIDRYLLPAPDLSSKPADRAAAVEGRDRRTDRQTLDRCMTLTAYSAVGT